MTAVSETPKNANFLSPLNFSFSIKRAPTVNFFVQAATVPSITLPAAEVPTPFVTIPKYGDHLEFEPLEITFKIDEDLLNYGELHEWMRRLAPPTSRWPYNRLHDSPPMADAGVTSDVSLQVLNGAKMPNFEFIFHDAWPTQLSGFHFDVTADDVHFVSASATFRYVYFDIQPLSG